MKKSDDAEKLMQALQNIEPLEDVPVDVSRRFQETLASLASQDLPAKKRGSWLTSGNQFALAASFTLVFALGAVLTLNSGDGSIQLNDEPTNQSSTAAPETNEMDDQLLYSGGEGATPKVSGESIKLSNSAHDYAEIPEGFQKTLGVGNTWNSDDSLDVTLSGCLNSLDLSQATNLIDTGSLANKPMRAIWAPVTATAWNVYLVDFSCNVIEKKYVQE
jgi:hypothetical protein